MTSSKRRSSPRSIKALSIRQPWAWLIVHGHKTIENRRWLTHYRGRLLIHAAIDPAPFYAELALTIEARHGIEVPARHDLDLGGIVGECELVDCVKDHQSPWFVGPFGFVLGNSKPRPFKRYRGRLSLFDVREADLH